MKASGNHRLIGFWKRRVIPSLRRFFLAALLLFLCGTRAQTVPNLHLVWSTVDGVTGYKVVIGKAPRVYTSEVSVPTNDAVLPYPTSKTYYSVVSVSDEGIESDYSNELSVPEYIVVSVYQSPSVTGPWTTAMSLTVTNPVGSGFFRMAISKQ